MRLRLSALAALAVAGVVAWVTYAGLHRDADAPAVRASAIASSAPIIPSASQLDSLENSFRALEDAQRELRRDRWDPEYVVSQVGRDPADLYEWVRTQTRWIPYRGVLRGPAGVLMDRQGNSLDRALLLTKLLQLAGHDARIACGEVDADVARRLLPEVLLAGRQRTGGEASDAAIAEPAAIATAYKLDGATIQRTLDAHSTRLTATAEKLAARTRDQTDRLLRTLARPDVSAEWRGRHDEAVRDLQDHCWSQLRTGERWQDLDVLSDSEQPITPPASTTSTIPELPESRYQQVVLKVVAEEWSRGALREQIVFTHLIAPAAVVGRSMVLQFWPTHWPTDVSSQPDGPYGLRETALEQNEWDVALRVDDDIVAQGAIRDSGAAQLTALWIEFEIRVPGTAPRTVRRVAFDVLGAAARAVPPRTLALSEAARLTRSLSLMMRSEILTLGADVAPELVAHLVGRNVLGNRDLFQAIARREFSVGSPEANALLERAPPIVTPLYSLALARARADVYVDRPVILMRHQYPADSRSGMQMRDATDIVTNEMGVDLFVPDAFAARVEQGVLDTNAEALLKVGGATGSTAEEYARSTEWSTLTPAHAGALASVPLSAEARAAVQRDLQAGYSVVVPSNGFAGWWRIDPRTGDTLGIGENGWGTAITERSMQNTMAWQMARTFSFEYAFCQALPQAMNAAQAVIRHEMPWWGVGEAANPMDLALQNAEGCLIGAMISTGITATLPLVMMRLNGLMRYMKELHYDTRGSARVPPKLAGPPESVPASRSGSGSGSRPRVPSPAAGSEGDALAKTEPALSPPQPPREPTLEMGRPPTFEEANAARENYRAKSNAAWDAFQDWVRYRNNSPNAAGKFPHSGTADPAVEEALLQQQERAQNEAIEALNRYEKIKELQRQRPRNPGVPGKIGPPPAPKPPAPAVDPSLVKTEVALGGLAEPKP